MHSHGPKSLEGPRRGSHGWWQGLGQATQPALKKQRKKRSDGNKETGIRQELVDRIRQEIAAGNYDTQEKWEAALDRLHARLSGD
jgi:hypothetical protein